MFDFGKIDKNGTPIALDSPYELRIFNDVTNTEIFKDPIVV